MFTSGNEVELLNALKQFFNFQYDIVDCKLDWGNYINGTWTGLTGEVFYNCKWIIINKMIKSINFQKANTEIGGVSMTYQRSQTVQYSKIYSFSLNTDVISARSLRFCIIIKTFIPN